jgi:hypothetical protein
MVNFVNERLPAFCVGDLAGAPFERIYRAARVCQIYQAVSDGGRSSSDGG